MVNNSTNINTSTQWTPIGERHVALEIQIVGFYDLKVFSPTQIFWFVTQCFFYLNTRAKFEFVIKKSDGQ